MKFNDNITLDIAKAVSDVLEGKVKKEEMDPTDHVKKSDEGKFCVYNAANKKVKEFDTKDEADKYAVDNHDKLMAAKNEVAEPEPKGEKDFKDKHVKKVSGMKNDGTNIKETKEEETPTGPAKEESEKQKKYQAFFAKALKKFGVKSPSELEGDKKKEFFDYVDANYEADNETDEGVKEEVDKLAVKKYANMKAKIGTLQNNIAKTRDSGFRMKNGGQEKIDGWNKDIEKIRDYMKKMVDKFGSGVSKGGPGFTGGA